MKKSFADIVASMQNDMLRKVASKIPSWAELEVPSALAYEQCSSEITARYKLRFVPQDAVVADLTGGLGVDSSAFATKASRLYYFERNAELCQAASRNFAKLGLAEKLVCSNEEVGPDSNLAKCDLVYADPARRSTAGKKVFLLEDCTPNILELLPMLWERTDRILLKLSPMADVSLVVGRLAQANMQCVYSASVKEVHLVEMGGEVKELLVFMEKGYDAEPLITCAALKADGNVQSFSFLRSTEQNTPASFCQPQPGLYIYVPGGSLLKAGAYNSIALPRLSQHSHLYLTDNADICREDGNCLFGRYYMIERIIPFNSKTIKELSGSIGNADVSCHDLPLRSEELAKRLKCKSGGDRHIFATSSPDGNLMIICRK